jgi:hypothetical protein
VKDERLPGMWGPYVVLKLIFLRLSRNLTRSFNFHASALTNTESHVSTCHFSTCHAANNSTPRPHFPGHSIHTLVTSSGDGYQNFQTRIMWDLQECAIMDCASGRWTNWH